MSTSKHPLSGHEPSKLPADDLDCDSGIGASRGSTAAGGLTKQREEPASFAGENTSEGDVANDAGLGGGVDPDQRGRTNK